MFSHCSSSFRYAWRQTHDIVTASRVLTSELCAWLPPSIGRNVKYATASDMDFTTPDSKRVRQHSLMTTPSIDKASATSSSSTSTTDPASTSRKSSKKTLPQPPTDAELENLYKELSQCGKPALLSLVPGYSEAYIPASATGSLPLPLTEVFQKDMLESSYPELLKVCSAVFDTITVTKEQASKLCEDTEKQSKSKVWFRHRAGRVTASRFKAAAHTNPDNPSQSLIKEICYPTSHKVYSEAITWGQKNEEVARAMYHSFMKEKHSNFLLTSSGLVVHPDYPYLGASPDGIVKCSCCTGTGVLEIKCPFRCKMQSFIEASKNKDFCLKVGEDGSWELNAQHAYYYQVQAQIKLTGAKYCDFVVWSPCEFVTLRINPDTEFISQVVDKVTKFYKLGVLPELVGKWFTKAPYYRITDDVTTNHEL